jgi:flagellar biosynthesis protein FlhG
MEKQNKKIIAFAGGKGGTGKSSISLCFADRYANRGKRVVIVDLDLGASNIHTMVGIHSPRTGLSDYLINNPDNRSIDNFVIATDIDNLSILSSNSISPGSANIEYQRKQKVIRAIKSIQSDIIILDIGAGSNFNSVDFFDEADIPVIVTTPEPTSIINGYEFLKNHLFRKFKQELAGNATALKVHKSVTSSGKNSFEFIELLKLNGEHSSADKIETICEHNSINMIMNRVKTSHTGVGRKLQELCKQFLNIELNYITNIQENPIFGKSVISGKPATSLDSSLADDITELLF